MSSSPIVDRIRIIPRPTDFLNRNVGSSGEVFYDKNANSLRVFSGKNPGGFEVLTNKSLSGVASYNYTVTVNNTGEGNKYILNEEYQPELTFIIGYTYIFDQSNYTNVYYPNEDGGVNNQHPLNFSADNANGELGGGTSYLDNVTYFLDYQVVNKNNYWNNFESARHREVQIQITNDTPATLYYWCQNHLNMGNEITVSDPGSGGGGTRTDVSDLAPESPELGSIWYNSSNGKLYIYVVDEDSGQWVQPSTPTPTALTDLGITDGTAGQILTTDGEGNFTFEDPAEDPGSGGGNIENFVFTSSTITTDDSSGIVVVPTLTVNSDIIAENDLIVNNNQTVTRQLNVAGDIVAGSDILLTGNVVTEGSGIPEISSDNEILLTATTRVEVSATPIKLASFTTAARDLLIAENGDLIYNTTDNKFQGYENGAWVNLV